MQRLLMLFGLLLLILAVWLLLIPGSTAEALPEYSTQTGEPCATCHVSPSGGGPRGPRGQAWVASSKPGEVPDLVQALELLGVEVSVDPAFFVASDSPIPEAEALGTVNWKDEPLFQWLGEYDGN